MLKRKLRKVAVACTAALTMLGVTSCGAAGGAAQGSDKEIHLAAAWGLTGPVAYAAVGASKGARLAIDEINSSGFLGKGVKLTFEEHDTGGEIDRAVSQTTQAMGNSEVDAILGPVSGQAAAAVAPSVNQRKVPTVFVQAGSKGVVTGDYTFRITPPMATYYDVAMDWLQAQGLTDISVIYNGTYPTFAELGSKVVPKLAKKRGITIGQSIQVQSTTQNFTSQAQEITSAKPDAVVMLLTAPQSVTFMSQLRQAGYDRQVVATSVQAAGNVSEAGKAADGLVYPVTFSTAMTQKASQEFTQAFQKKYGEVPDGYAAEGYDAVWWTARAIKASGDYSREGIRNGLGQVAKEGFTGAQGELSFEGNDDARVSGVVVRWKNGQESLAN